jgi:dTDP-3-amino-3,4,6-trideoxy-alpha-D-glucose transaminase
LTPAEPRGAQPRLPLFDLRRRWQPLAPEVEAARERILASGRLLDGPEREGFEREWATFTARRFAVAVGSGTDALRLTLLALGIGPGDEVIVPAFTAVPTVAAVCATGATPVPVDVDAGTAALDEAAARSAVTSRTAALVAVHLYGRPAPLPELDLPVIEDAAHAHGALRGPGGLAAAYSFYPTKNLGGIGDGGAVVTDDPELADGVARLRAHGRDQEGVHRAIATNSRMSELEAAALRAALPGLSDANGRRSEIARMLRGAAPQLRWHRDHRDHVHHLCVAAVEDRDVFRAGMPFETGVHYPRAIVDEPAYAGFERDPVPRARAWAASCVSVPCHPEMTPDEVERVAEALRSWEI